MLPQREAKDKYHVRYLLMLDTVARRRQRYVYMEAICITLAHIAYDIIPHTPHGCRTRENAIQFIAHMAAF